MRVLILVLIAMHVLPRHHHSSVRLGSTQALPFVGWPFRLGPKELKTHMHCMGLTGQGKSKLLAHFASQLILNGRAVAVLDPHADLAHDVLAQLLSAGYFQRPEAMQKVLYIDFSDRSAALPFNVLRQPYPIDEVARLIVEACTRAWPSLADGNAPQFENILLASIPVLIANDLCLTDMTRLLSDRPYRERLLQNVTDPQIISFYHDRFDQWGRETPLLVESALRRVFLLSYSPALRDALSQKENALNFRAIMDEQISLIVNLGGLDEQTQRLLGCLVTVGFEVAALSRADMLEEKRAAYHLVLDEFASFSAQSEETLSRVLSLTRKYGLFCVLAHQTFSQLSSRLAGALQNTVQIAFRLGRDDAMWAAPRFGSFDPMRTKHTVEDEHAETRTHPLFYSVQEQYEAWAKALETLRPREAFVRIQRKTVKIRTATVKHRVSWEAVDRLRQLYAQCLLRSRPPDSETQLVERTESQEPTTKRVMRVSPLLSPMASPTNAPTGGRQGPFRPVKRSTAVAQTTNGSNHRIETQDGSEVILARHRRSVAAV